MDDQSIFFGIAWVHWRHWRNCWVVENSGDASLKFFNVLVFQISEMHLRNFSQYLFFIFLLVVFLPTLVFCFTLTYSKIPIKNVKTKETKIPFCKKELIIMREKEKQIDQGKIFIKSKPFIHFERRNVHFINPLNPLVLIQ